MTSLHNAGISRREDEEVSGKSGFKKLARIVVLVNTANFSQLDGDAFKLRLTTALSENEESHYSFLQDIYMEVDTGDCFKIIVKSFTQVPTISSSFARLFPSVRSEKKQQENSEEGSSDTARRMIKSFVEQRNPLDLKTIGEVLNWLTDNQLPDLYYDLTQTLNRKRDFLFWAILKNQLEKVRIIWETIPSDYIASALMISQIMKFISNILLTQNLIKLSRQYRELSDEFENRATAILHTSYEVNKEAKYCLIRKLTKWNDKTLLQIAYSGEHINFIEDDCCQAVLGTIWYGKISPSTSSSFLLLCIFLPFPFLNLVDFETENKPTPIPCNYLCDIWSKFRSFYEAPIIKFITNTISFLVFLALFSFFVLTDLRPDVISVYEYLVWCWALTMWLDEVRQLIDIDAPTLRLKFVGYFHNSWNIFDQITFFIMIIAVVLRTTLSEEKFEWAAMIYSINLVMFILRILENFYANGYIGPKVEMIYRMLKDLIFFLLIFAVFMFAYGIAAQSLLYPNAEPSWNVLFKIVYRPYFAIFGQFDDLHDQVFGCTKNETILSNNPDIPRCSWLAVLMFSVYVMISCILLINLLIAMFNSTFQKVDDIALQTWLFHRFEIILEYDKKPVLVPPFIIFNLIYRIFKKCRSNQVDPHTQTDLDDIEKTAIIESKFGSINLDSTTKVSFENLKTQLNEMKSEMSVMKNKLEDVSGVKVTMDKMYSLLQILVNDNNKNKDDGKTKKRTETTIEDNDNQ